MQLGSIATTTVISIRPSDTADTAIALMEEHDIHHLPVVIDDRPVGMVSDRDLLRVAGGMMSRERTDHHDGNVIGPQRISDIMSTPVQTLGGNDRVEDAAHLMLRERVGAVALIKEGKLDGMIAESDVLRCFVDDRMVFTDSHWRFEKVADHMSVNVFSLKANDPIIRATRLMKDKSVRHVLVMKDDHVVGVVSDRDIRKAHFREQMEWFKDDEPPEKRMANLGDVMTRHPVKVLPDSTLADAASRLIEARIGALPVVEHGRLCGILTETDLLRVFVRADPS
jgi:CBS domain-containing protein